MTPLEVILIVILVVIAGFAIYFFFKGAKGDISLASPMESRVDEYLDRRFESLVTEWALVRTPQARRFVEEHEPQLAADEAEIGDLKVFGDEIGATLNRLEERLEALEKEVDRPGRT